jgi:mono/diheme cytochrome c family protein
MCVDHGWWGAQMLAPYVSEKVSWAIRYHQALRFSPDESVGYKYPEFYVELFGPNYLVVNGRRAMPGFGPYLSDEQVADVVSYIRTHFGNSYRDPVRAQDVARMRGSMK